MDSVIPATSRDTLWLAGRILLGAPYLVGGIRHFFILPVLTQMIAARGVPAPRFVLVAGSTLQIVAGAALILGIHPAWAAVALIVFTLSASTMLLNFWSLEGAERVNAINAWWSNIGLIGGLLLVAAQTAGVPGS
jgi:putative oxidoreductase